MKKLILILTILLGITAAQAQTVRQLSLAQAVAKDATHLLVFDYEDLAALSSSSTNVNVNVFPAPGSTNTFESGFAVMSAYYDLTAFRNSSATATNLLVKLGDVTDDDRIFTAFQANNADTNRPFVASTVTTIPFVHTNANRLVLNFQSTNAAVNWSTYTSGVLRVYLKMFPVADQR